MPNGLKYFVRSNQQPAHRAGRSGHGAVDADEDERREPFQSEGLHGDAVRIEEHQELVRQRAEDGRIAVRNVRRDVMHHLKELVQKGEAQADDEHRAEERVQKVTDEHTTRIDELLKRKEAEIMEV